MPSDDDIIQTIQKFLSTEVFLKKKAKKPYDDYKQSWRDTARSEIGREPTDVQLSNFTTKKIQEAAKAKFGYRDISVEHRINQGLPSQTGYPGLRFDIYNNTTRTAFEICLGAIKNEFEKNILKAMLDLNTVKLVILYREYKTGDTYYGRDWFNMPSNREIINLVRHFKLKVEPILAVPDPPKS